jgi:hypothetical protein
MAIAKENVNETALIQTATATNQIEGVLKGGV